MREGKWRQRKEKKRKGVGDGGLCGDEGQRGETSTEMEQGAGKA